MIVVSSGQLEQTTSKPITIAVPGGGTKTVTLAPGAKVASTVGGQQLIATSSGQYIAVPAQGMTAGGKVVQVAASAAGTAAGQKLTVVQPAASAAGQIITSAGDGQKMIVVQQAVSCKSSPVIVRCTLLYLVSLFCLF